MPNGDKKFTLQEAMDQKSSFDDDNAYSIHTGAPPPPGYEGNVRPDIEDLLDRKTHKSDVPGTDEPLAFYDDVIFLEKHFNKIFAKVLEGNQDRIKWDRNGAPRGAPSQFTGKDEISGADTNSNAKPVDGSGNIRKAANPDPVGDSSGELIPSSHGVFGIKGLELRFISNSAQESLIVSPSRTVHLDSGTRMILRVLGK